MWEVYKITNKIDGKFYIGKGKIGAKRWRDHLRDAKAGRGYYIHNAIRCHGLENFIYEVLKTFDVELDAYQFEKETIITTNACENGYNIQTGGTPSDLELERLRRSKSVESSWTSDRRKQQSESYKGEGNPFFGKSHSLEVLLKISEASKNMSNETRKKISEKLTGGKRTLETRKLMSESSSTKGKTLEEVYGKEYAESVKSKQRGRRESVTGEKHPNAKITTQDVIEIRTRASNGESPKVLATEFHLSESGTRKIIAKVTWRHI
jgi:group I intron endonuclease